MLVGGHFFLLRLFSYTKTQLIPTLTVPPACASVK